MGDPRFDDADDLPNVSERCCDLCGCALEWEDCWQCGGKGGRDGDDLMEEDPMWYCEDDWETCDICEGAGGYWICPALPHEVKEQ